MRAAWNGVSLSEPIVGAEGRTELDNFVDDNRAVRSDALRHGGPRRAAPARLLFCYQRMSNPIVTQRLGGVAMFVAATVIWFDSGFGWLPFVLLLFAFDVFMLGYLAGPKVGAAVYNVGHGLALPSISALVYVLTGVDWILALTCLWFAHIGIDFAFGYGLKPPEGFHATHLGTIGKRRPDVQ